MKHQQKKSGFDKLYNQRVTEQLCTIYRVVKIGDLPEPILELLKLRNSNYNVGGSDILNIPKVNSTTHCLKSWRYTTSKLWNSIPDDYRKLDNYNIFRRMLTELDYSTLDFQNIACLCIY